MGLFGKYVFEGKALVTAVGEAPAEPWLSVDIHDSDFAAVVYRPAGTGAGIAYLGDTPRTYFDDEDASEPTDTGREGRGLAEWAALVGGTAAADELACFLAEDGDPEDVSEFEADDVDDADVFVEIKTARFLTALGLPVPEELIDSLP